MTLRHKLLLVALCTLALPVAGWLYVRQMEALLREGQAQALIASARAVARSLVVTHAALPQGDEAWYVERAINPITVDGYGDDWAPLTPWSQPFGARGKLLLAGDANGLYLYAEVRDTRRTRADGILKSNTWQIGTRKRAHEITRRAAFEPWRSQATATLTQCTTSRRNQTKAEYPSTSTMSGRHVRWSTQSSHRWSNAVRARATQQSNRSHASTSDTRRAATEQWRSQATH